MDFGVLGPLEVRGADGLIELRRGASMSVLGALILRAPSTVAASALAEMLWPDDQPANPANALQVQVSILRKQLGSAGRRPLVKRVGGYALEIGDDEIDARRFERLVVSAAPSSGNPAPLSDQLDRLDAALALWRGGVLENVDHTIDRGEVTRLEELRHVAVERRIDVLLGLGRHREVVGEIRRLIEHDPLRERLHEQLILALYRSGRQADALRAYEAARTMLAEELGVSPGRELQALERRVLQQDRSIDWSGPAPASAHPRRREVDARFTALPVAVTSLIGRSADVAAVRALLGRVRIVTITGPGGGGKTRLALEVAHLERQSQAVWFVDLGGVRDGGDVVLTVAATLGIGLAGGEDPRDAVLAGLANRQGVLVLDTCEHVIHAAADLVSRIAGQCADVRILATSRRPLAVRGETTWPLGPLPLPTDDVASIADVEACPSVELYVERARAVRPDFSLTAQNVADVAAVCTALDGLPLAIELAAARADVITPRATRDRLSRRFDLLVDGDVDAADRQQTLRAAVEWSVRLLEPPQREFFAALSVFAGTFDLVAAAAVAAEDSDDHALAMLSALVRHSVVASAGEGRFRLLDSLRAYAAELLTETDAAEARDRHAAHFVADVDAAASDVGRNEQLVALRQLRLDRPNHRVAIVWLLERGDDEGAARMVASLGWFWALEGLQAEAVEHLERVLALTAVSVKVRVRAMWCLSLIRSVRGELQSADELAAESISLAKRDGRPEDARMALLARGIAVWARGDLDSAAVVHDEALDLCRLVGDQWGVALGSVLRARTAMDRGETDADDRARASLRVARESGDRHLIGLALELLARLALRSADHRQALELAEESLRMQQSVGYSEGVLASLHLLGVIALANGDRDRATEHHVEALRLALDVAHAAGTCEALEGLADVAAARGDAELAARLNATAVTERASRGVPPRRGERPSADELGAGTAHLSLVLTPERALELFAAR